MIAYDFKGRTHYLSDDELDAVERSGRSSLERYARVKELNKRPAPAKELVAAMDERGGAVKEGERPLDMPQQPRLFMRPNPNVRASEMWHLAKKDAGTFNATSCGNRANPADVFGFVRFTRCSDMPKICPQCHKAWVDEMLGDKPRKMKNTWHR